MLCNVCNTGHCCISYHNTTGIRCVLEIVCVLSCKCLCMLLQCIPFQTAKTGNESATRAMAKQLVGLRAQRDKLYTMKANITAVGYQVRNRIYSTYFEHHHVVCTVVTNIEGCVSTCTWFMLRSHTVLPQTHILQFATTTITQPTHYTDYSNGWQRSYGRRHGQRCRRHEAGE
jgi:hypothetical protein